MKKLAFILCSIYLFFSFQGCNQSVRDQQVFTNSNDTLITEYGIWYEYSRDTTLIFGNKQVYVKMEIVNIPDEFLEQKGIGDNGQVLIQQVPNNEIYIQIPEHLYKLQKQDIPDLDSEFLNRSVFQRIDFHSITEETFVFEIILGVSDTCDIVIVFLTIDSKGNKSFRIEYPEWEDD
jgi:hypothetical protein